jgi:hypothetical protein
MKTRREDQAALDRFSIAPVAGDVGTILLACVQAFV